MGVLAVDTYKCVYPHDHMSVCLRVFCANILDVDTHGCVCLRKHISVSWLWLVTGMLAVRVASQAHVCFLACVCKSQPNAGRRAGCQDV